jgi:hypothetical protein
VAQVIGELEVGIVHPVRPADRQEWAEDALAKTRNSAGSALNGGDEIRPGRSSLQQTQSDQRRASTRVGIPVQEQGIDRSHLFGFA